MSLPHLSARTGIFFRIDPAFVADYAVRKAPFGFNGLGELVYRRTYSRLQEDGTNEDWHDTVERVVNGTYSMQKRWIKAHHLPWSETKAQRSAQEMYDRIWNMKFLPPGRGLWAMGSPLTEDRGLFAALNNCSFVSTENLVQDLTEPFTFLMDASMLGIGVGFDTRGAGQIVLHPGVYHPTEFVIPDTREGWIESLHWLLFGFFTGATIPTFRYDEIRPAGSPIKGFGGISAGPEPLRQLHETLFERLNRDAGKAISITNIVDIQNLIGTCVVAGNVRRTAEVAFGDPVAEYLDLKNYEANPEREAFGWTSNNSIFAELGMDYRDAAFRTHRNGEPGYMWLDNTRNYGRMEDGLTYTDTRVMGANPCVTGDTLILTQTGYQPIESLVGELVTVWNGFEWSEVTPRVTGYNQPTLRIKFSNGRSLHCTPYHQFVLATDYKGGTKRVEARKLRPGMKLMKHEFPVIEGARILPFAYTQGFKAGDGTDDDRSYLLVYGEKQQCLPYLAGTVGTHYTDRDATYVRTPVLGDKTFVPNTEWSVQSRLDWFAGLLDADGCELREGGIQIVSVNEDFLSSVQLMLTTLGVSSKIRPAMEAGIRELPDSSGGKAAYHCLGTQRLLVGAVQMQQLRKLGLVCHRLRLDKASQRDASRFVTVESIESAETAEVVYCFTEPKRNLGCFNGVVTGQCLEQSLESYELCCLVETFPARHESYEDFERTLKYAYLYGKTVTLGPTPWTRTNRVMLRNRRIGLSQSGVVQAIGKLGIEQYREWCDNGYHTIQSYDTIYSEWLAIPRSIKTTSVKPSGTVSLLAGATPGVHFPESRCYIRRMRLSKWSPLVEPLRQAGYPIEADVRSPDSTLVVEIPVRIAEAVREASEVSMWEQLALAAFMQRWWSDNMVSCTVTFDPTTEGPQLEAALNIYQYQLKAVSFLPRHPAGAYDQMPYEAITEAEYDRRAAALLPLNFSGPGEDAVAERFCNNDSCTIG